LDVRLRFDVGTSGDTPATAGLTALAMNLLDEGTGKKSAIQISEQLQTLGATLSSGAGLDVSTVSLTALKTNLEDSLSLMSEVVLRPSFPAADFERLKQQQLAQIKQEKNSPTGMALRLAPKLYFGDGHPYSLPSSGSGFEATVEKLTRDQVLGWAKRSLRPGSATLAVVGETTMAELLPKLEKAFGGWSGGTAPKLEIPPVSLGSKPVAWLIDRPGSLQSFIVVGHPAPPTNNPDEIAIEGFNKNLGGDFNSRLNMNLRENKHWSYGVRTFLGNAKGQRAFAVFAPVQTDKTKESLVEIRKELNEIVSTRPATPEEFDRIQADRVLKLPGQWETIGAVQSSLGTILSYGLPDSYYQSYADRVRQLKREELDTAAKKVLKPSSLVWVVVGDRSKIEQGVKELNLGELRYADADGNPLAR
jgi:zinc protease